METSQRAANICFWFNAGLAVINLAIFGVMSFGYGQFAALPAFLTVWFVFRAWLWGRRLDKPQS